MATKIYQLQASAAPYIVNGRFKFKVAYDKLTLDGGKRVVSAREAPIIDIPENGVISTSNTTAQRMIENYKAGATPLINGSTRSTGFFFQDVTSSNPPVDLDLDTILI